MIAEFIYKLFDVGTLQGMKLCDAHPIACGLDTTTQNDIALGIINIQVRFAPVDPAEFIMIPIQHFDGDSGESAQKMSHISCTYSLVPSNTQL